MILKKCLNLNDYFQRLSVQNKIFSQRMFDYTVTDKDCT